jgi:serine/threonine protein kinase
MLAGDPPFTAKNQKDLDRKILSEKFTAPSYLGKNTHSLLKGMLEKDVNKRLGAAKSNMFSIGGVAALKQHAFFDGLDWSALERCEITPPINVSAPLCPPINGHLPNGQLDPITSSTPGFGSGWTTPGGGNATDMYGCGSPQVEMSMTAHFDIEFTGEELRERHV